MPRNQEELIVPFGQKVQMNDGGFATINWSVTQGSVEVFRADNDAAHDAGVAYPAGRGERDIEASAISHAAGENLYMIGRFFPVSKVVVDHA